MPGRGAYALYYDTALETSSIRYTADCTAAPVVWEQGESFEGEYTELRLGEENGQVTAFGYVNETPVEGAWSHTWDFLVSNGGWTSTQGGPWVYGSGWQLYCAPDPFDGWEYGNIDIVSPAFTDATITSLTLEYYNSYAIEIGGLNLTDWKYSLAPAGFGGNIEAPIPTGTQTYTDTISIPATDSTAVHVFFRLHPTLTFGETGDAYIRKVTLTGTGIDPFPTVGYFTRYSDDYGATVSAAESIGDTASAIDTQKDGTQVLIGGDGQTIKATAGGAYSNYGSAKTQGCLYIPRYLFPPGVLSNDGANPQFLLAASALDSGASLWRVSSSGAAFTDITPLDGSDEGLATGPRCLSVHWQNSSHLLCILIFNATVKLAVSTDAGATWKFSSALNASAFGITTQRGSMKVCGWANGNKVGIVKNYTAATITFVERTLPLTQIIALDLFG